MKRLFDRIPDRPPRIRSPEELHAADLVDLGDARRKSNQRRYVDNGVVPPVDPAIPWHRSPAELADFERAEREVRAILSARSARMVELMRGSG